MKSFSSTTKIIKEKIVKYYNFEFTCDHCGFKVADPIDREPSSYSSASDEMRQHLRRCELNYLESQLDWEECEYPYMGSASENGSANLKSEEQTERLIELKKTYDYHYVLEWSGPGLYKMIPSWKHGRGSNFDDILYTATLVKEDI